MLSNSCLATERGRRCNIAPSFNSKWCAVHEELQAKSLKSYKRISLELEDFRPYSLATSDVARCESPDELRLWAESFRKKWVLTKRTIDSRTKHHLQFYSGGDSSHQAFIAGLTAQKSSLEELLLCIDDRAYVLLLSKEKVDWLNAPSLPGPVCDAKPAPELLQVVNVLDIASSDDSSVATADQDEGTFSDLTTETESAASCTSDCCLTAKVIHTPTYRQRILAYLGYSSYFCHNEADFHLARTIMENVFRFVISRIPRLLVRARAAGCATVECFLTSGELGVDDYAQLWRAMKYHNVNEEGKITVHTIRNAICDAENMEADRQGAFIELLGSKVWKTPLEKDLSPTGWDHFYRFTSCSGCALSVVRSFPAWARLRHLSRPGSLYSSWSEAEETAAESALGACGAIVCGSYQKAKTGSLEHVKPNRKGLKSVWIERDTRNWAFLRFDEANPLAIGLYDARCPEMAVFSWPDYGNIQDSQPIWVSRLRSGYTTAERKAARWTNDGSFVYTDCTHRRLLSTSPETYFRNGQPFVEGSVDLLVVDCGREQKLESFLAKIVDMMGAAWRGDEARSDLGIASSRTLDDRPMYLARQFFRES